MEKRSGENIGAQVMVRDRATHHFDDLRDTPDRQAVIVPFRHGSGRNPKQSGERRLRPAQPITPDETPVHPVVLTKKLQIYKTAKGCKVDRERYTKPMVKMQPLPVARHPAEFSSFADWLRDICSRGKHGVKTQIATETELSPSIISTYSNGGPPPPPNTLRKFARVLPVPGLTVALTYEALLKLAHPDKSVETEPLPQGDADTAKLLMYWPSISDPIERRAIIDLVKGLAEAAAVRSTALLSSVRRTSR